MTLTFSTPRACDPQYPTRSRCDTRYDGVSTLRPPTAGNGFPCSCSTLSTCSRSRRLSPWLVWRAVATGRYRRELGAKLFGRVSVPQSARKPVAWFHAVSVGEVNLLGTLVAAFRKRHPDWLVVVSSTTDTGLAEARKRFPDLAVIAWPFDFSWAVGGRARRREAGARRAGRERAVAELPRCRDGAACRWSS